MNSITITDIERSKCLKSFQFFTRFFFKHQNGKKFSVNKHHDIIFNALEDVHKGECKRLIINIAPRYSKTEISVINFIAYSLALNPKARFIHLSYSDGLALDNSEKIKDLITSEKYQELFPYVKIKSDSKAKDKWYTTEGGGVLARSASGQVTGFGAGQTDFDNEIVEFGGAIIIDDPLKASDSESFALREKVNYRFDSTIRNRVNSRDTPIIIIMQRLHPNDLCGYLNEIEPEEWRTISLPVIQEDGTALWSDKHTIDELLHLRKINETVFETQYMQNPQPKEGLLFLKNELQFQDFTNVDFKDSPGGLSYIDVADTGEDNHCVIIAKMHENKLFIVDVLFTKLGTDQNVQLSANILNEYKPRYCKVESNFGGTMYSQLLKPKLDSFVSLIPTRAKSNKHARITQLAGIIKLVCVFRSNYAIGSDYDKFMKNIFEYNKNGTAKHDDAPDCLEGLVKMAIDTHPSYFKKTIAE
jgi:predicted phage terminase large subunit-like protein